MKQPPDPYRVRRLFLFLTGLYFRQVYYSGRFIIPAGSLFRQVHYSGRFIIPAGSLFRQVYFQKEYFFQNR
jgi:hypothetical protein